MVLSQRVKQASFCLNIEKNESDSLYEILIYKLTSPNCAGFSQDGKNGISSEILSRILYLVLKSYEKWLNLDAVFKNRISGSAVMRIFESKTG